MNNYLANFSKQNIKKVNRKIIVMLVKKKKKIITSEFPLTSNKIDATPYLPVKKIAKFSFKWKIF